jgi:hypothetical protein
VLEAGLVLIKCAHVIALSAVLSVSELSEGVLSDLQSPGQSWPFGWSGRMTGYFSPKVNAYCRVHDPKIPWRNLDFLQGD